jgi:hypothetical protein
MAVTVGWDNDEMTVLVIRFQRPWDWSEFNRAVEELSRLLASVEHKVDIIFDIREAGFPPEGAVNRFRKAAEIRHSNVNLLIYIAPPVLAQFVRGIVTIIRAVFGAFEREFIFVTTIEAAHDAIASARATTRVGES